MNIYIPVSIYNFNVILETESISPKAFYKQRCFGNHHFRDTSVDNLHEAEYLYLYKEMPNVTDDDVMFLSINFELLEKECVINIHEDVFAYPKTIYINPQCLDIWFMSEKHLQETIIYANNFSTLKLKRYTGAFKTLKFFPLKQYTLETIKNSNNLIEQTIKNDNFFNHFKGFVYGIAIGNLSNNKTASQKNLLKLFQDISGSFTTIKSELLIRESQKDNFKKHYDNNNNINIYQKDFLSLIHSLEKVFYESFPQELENQYDNSAILKNEIERFTNVMSTQNAYPFQIESFEEIGNFLLLNPFQKAISLFQEYVNLSKSQISLNSDFAERKAEYFKTIFADLKRQTEKLLSYQVSYKEANIPAFIDNLKVSPKGEIELHLKQFGLSKLENSFLEIILTVLFNDDVKRSNPSELTTKEKTTIIDKVGTLVNEKGLREHFRDGLVSLRNFFTSFASFPIEKVNSEVLKNFACFLVKPNNLDDCIKYLETKKVAQMQIGICFWCAYNGFASINENNLKHIWNNNIHFDDYLCKAYANLQIDFTLIYNKEIYQRQEILVETQPLIKTLPSAISTESDNNKISKLRNNLNHLLVEYPQYSLFIKNAFAEIDETENIEKQKDVFLKMLKGDKQYPIKKPLKITFKDKLFND